MKHSYKSAFPLINTASYLRPFSINSGRAISGCSEINFILFKASPVKYQKNGKWPIYLGFSKHTTSPELGRILAKAAVNKPEPLPASITLLHFLVSIIFFKNSIGH